MKKYFLIIVLFAVFYLKAICQSSPAYIIDSLRLDSLKRTLSLTTGSSKVDLLNEIGLRTGYLAPGRYFIDSIHFYASQAHDEATRISYKSGTAMSLLLLSGSEFFWNQPVTDEQTKESNIREAVKVAEEVNDNKLLAWAYYYESQLPSVRKNNYQYFACYEKAIGYFQKIGDTLRQAEINFWLCQDYSSTGEYERAFDYGKKSLQLSKKSETNALMSWQQYLVQNSMRNLNYIYSAAGDYEDALNYLREENQYALAHQTGDGTAINMAEIFSQMGQYDSAMVYWNEGRNQVDWNTSGKGFQVYAYRVLGQIYLGLKQYDKALDVFDSWSDTLQKYKPSATAGKVTLLIEVGHAYYGKKNYSEALRYANQGFNLATHENQRSDMMEGYQLLSQVYHQLGNNDSAYKYLLKYHSLRDSTLNKQFLLRLYDSRRQAEDERKESALLLLQKSSQLKGAQLKQESIVKNFLIGGLIILIIAGVFIYRSVTLKRKTESLLREQLENNLRVQQLENEKKQAELQQQAGELEMQALRSQLNPHFIFNCLSSINRIILKSEIQTASDYLTRFSRLIRMVLINSQKSMIPLEDELQMLRLYLDMERLRSRNSFDYVISFVNEIDASTVSIPPLLLQPFCENAVWHGLMQKAGQGHINISLSMEDDVLQCTITDDGIGREKAAEMEEKSAEKGKSLGLQITAQRLALLNRNKTVHTFYAIEDVLDENKNVVGTKVVLKMGYKEFTGELVH